jgi:hypothetical protein
VTRTFVAAVGPRLVVDGVSQQIATARGWWKPSGRGRSVWTGGDNRLLSPLLPGDIRPIAGDARILVITPATVGRTVMVAVAPKPGFALLHYGSLPLQ